LDFRTVLTVWYFLVFHFILLDFRTVPTVWYFLVFPFSSVSGPYRPIAPMLKSFFPPEFSQP